MLDIARATNPEVTYLRGDMRSVDLRQEFDVVAIPDCIDYMATLPDLQSIKQPLFPRYPRSVRASNGITCTVGT